MHLHHTLLLVTAAALLLNLPFGFWRAGVKRFSPSWFLAVHVPVPLIIGLRIASGIGWRLISFPLLIGAFCTGQFLGGKLRFLRKRDSLKPEGPTESP
jgi:hypothetical protein